MTYRAHLWPSVLEWLCCVPAIVEMNQAGWRRPTVAADLINPTRAEEAPAAGSALATFPGWSLLAGELEATGKDVLVRIELAPLKHGPASRWRCLILRK